MSAGLPFQLKYWSRDTAACAQALVLFHMLNGFLACMFTASGEGSLCYLLGAPLDVNL